LAGLLRKLFGTHNERTLRALRKTVRAINELSGAIAALDDAALAAKTPELRARLGAGADL
jgi:preprotein translocase subunit SecA